MRLADAACDAHDHEHHDGYEGGNDDPGGRTRVRRRRERDGRGLAVVDTVGGQQLHIDGERIADCSAPDVARELHQILDTVVVVRDPVGGGTGVGNCQPIVAGDHPELGLEAASSFW